MSNIVNPYTTFSRVTETGMLFYFVSVGKKVIVKAVRYTCMQELLGKMVYNMALGDYDPLTGALRDNSISNNGDHYRVFQTALSTIPEFLKIKNAMIHVRGRDSRRMNVYRAYVEKNYNTLSKDYIFYEGKTIGNHIAIKFYEKGGGFDSIIFSKKM